MPCRDPREDMSLPQRTRVEKQGNFRAAASLLFETCKCLSQNRKKGILSKKIKTWYKTQTLEVGGIAEIERTINRVWNADLDILSKELDNVTRMLCFLCKKLIKNNLEQFMADGLPWWWKIHQRIDNELNKKY